MLDEATSALDSESESIVQAALDKVSNQKINETSFTCKGFPPRSQDILYKIIIIIIIIIKKEVQRLDCEQDN